jgi:GIY-YIG catalytic domain
VHLCFCRSQPLFFDAAAARCLSSPAKHDSACTPACLLVLNAILSTKHTSSKDGCTLTVASSDGHAVKSRYKETNWSMPNNVYALFYMCEGSKQYFYVGRSKNVERRIRQHEYSKRRGHEDKYHKIRDLEAAKIEWLHEVIEVVEERQK